MSTSDFSERNMIHLDRTDSAKRHVIKIPPHSTISLYNDYIAQGPVWLETDGL